MVLRTVVVVRPIPGNSLVVSLRSISLFRAGDGVAKEMSSVRICTSGRRLVCAVLLSFGLQAADLYFARIPLPRAGLRLLPGHQSMAAEPGDTLRWSGRVSGSLPLP